MLFKFFIFAIRYEKTDNTIKIQVTHKHTIEPKKIKIKLIEANLRYFATEDFNICLISFILFKFSIDICHEQNFSTINSFSGLIIQNRRLIQF